MLACRHPVLALALAAITLSLAACSGSDGMAPDAGGRPDAGRDAAPLPGPIFDTSTTWNAPPLPCPDGPARREGRDLGEKRRFALSVLHYNIQYVAGGLANFRVAGREVFPGASAETDDQVQDKIVTESLVPVLDMLDHHPTWTLSIEMQGYMVEILLARFPDMAKHLERLVRSGQVELISFHYADQLFLAYPRHHMELSHTLDQKVLADGCMAASDPVFTQEGQFGIGMADLLGAGSILLLPKNLFHYFHAGTAIAPYYETDGVPVVVAGEGTSDGDSGFETQWIYMDDAEKLATGGLDPYFPDAFVAKQAAIDMFEQQLEHLEADGWTIAGVSDYVATLRSAGVTPTALPPMLDGTWQPDDTKNLGRWMGNAGTFAATERDNAVLAHNSAAGRMALAAETAVVAARAADHPLTGADATLQRAWRDLFLGEVSDATGWNPIGNEVYYGLWHAQAASSRARDLAMQAASALGIGLPFVVDTATGTVMPASAAPPPVEEPVTTPPLHVMRPEGSRAYRVVWKRYRDEPDHYVLTIDMAAESGAATVSFPWPLAAGDGGVVRYTPALLDGTTIDLPLAQVTLPESAAISIASGPFGLDHDLWLIPDNATVHLAARLDPSAHTVTFRDETLPIRMSDEWVFHVVTGPAARALAVADAVNLHPRVRIDAGTDGAP